MEETIEEENSARSQRDRHDLAQLHLVVADLPVAPLEVHHRSVAVRARDDVHTAILNYRVIERDPAADDGSADGQVEVRVVLVPGLLAPHEWRLEQRLVGKE